MIFKKFHEHKGLVLALLSTLAQITHASFRTPVRMPPTSRPEIGSRHQAQLLAQNALLSHTPKGIQQWQTLSHKRKLDLARVKRAGKTRASHRGYTRDPSW